MQPSSDLHQNVGVMRTLNNHKGRVVGVQGHCCCISKVHTVYKKFAKMEICWFGAYHTGLLAGTTRRLQPTPPKTRVPSPAACSDFYRLGEGWVA